MKNRNYYTLTLSLLGAAKLVLDSFGLKIITDQNVNDVANAVATLMTFAGVVMTHLKYRPKLQFKGFLSNLFKNQAADQQTAKPDPSQANQKKTNQ